MCMLIIDSGIRSRDGSLHWVRGRSNVALQFDLSFFFLWLDYLLQNTTGQNHHSLFVTRASLRSATLAFCSLPSTTPFVGLVCVQYWLMCVVVLASIMYCYLQRWEEVVQKAEWCSCWSIRGNFLHWYVQFCCYIWFILSIVVDDYLRKCKVFWAWLCLSGVSTRGIGHGQPCYPSTRGQ